VNESLNSSRKEAPRFLEFFGSSRSERSDPSDANPFIPAVPIGDSSTSGVDSWSYFTEVLSALGFEFLGMMTA